MYRYCKGQNTIEGSNSTSGIGDSLAFIFSALSFSGHHELHTSVRINVMNRK